jgi:50S ribosomal subunit-associated GTPase HflX
MNTLLQLERYAAEMRSMNPRARFVVAANKIDAHEQHQMDPADVRAAAERLGAPYHLTSAKSGDRVAAAFRQLASMLVEDNRNTNATGMDSHASS